jgi:ATP-dependent 26S proteasome regulatory subunit
VGRTKPVSIVIEKTVNDTSELMAGLSLIDSKLRQQIKRAASKTNYWQKDDLRGLYISEAEICDLQSNSPLGQKSENHPPSEFPCDVHLPDTTELAKNKEHRLVRSQTSRLERLVDMYNLSTLEKNVLLLCLLPEVDLKYQRIFGYVQDDVTKKSPSVALALDMLCKPTEKLLGRQIFSSSSNIIKKFLVSLQDDAGRKSGPLLAKSLVVDARIRNYLFGFDELDSNLLPFTKIIKPQKGIEDIILSDNIKDRLHRLTIEAERHPITTFYFYGAKYTGKQTTAESICHDLNLDLLVADTVPMLNSALPIEILICLLCREAQLQDMPIYLDNFHTLFDDSLSYQLKTAMMELTRCPSLVFLAGTSGWSANYSWQNRRFIEMEFSIPEHSQRKQIWQAYLDHRVPAADSISDALAAKFRLSNGQISESIALSQNLAISRDGGDIAVEDLYQACRRVSNQKLKELAHKIEPRYNWDDIILPKDQLEQLKEICHYVKYGSVVYDKWGFGRKLSLGKGLNALFSGPSGTGKTMAAEIMAKELNLDLYKIDLSMVVSKYIGETEKNLDKIFKEAQNSNSILFFDEADAIFGKRSEVKDSHDRYANIEIAYLLQKMEEYDGIVILATNLRKNLDEAFIRRLHFSVDFPFPEEGDRYHIWQKAFPKAAPLSEDIDLAFMAQHFRMAGGNIKNIVLSAAFLAADNGYCITMEKLIRATKREYQKMGKLCTEADFGHYFELVKG